MVNGQPVSQKSSQLQCTAPARASRLDDSQHSMIHPQYGELHAVRRWQYARVERRTEPRVVPSRKQAQAGKAARSTQNGRRLAPRLYGGCARAETREDLWPLISGRRRPWRGHPPHARSVSQRRPRGRRRLCPCSGWTQRHSPLKWRHWPLALRPADLGQESGAARRRRLGQPTGHAGKRREARLGLALQHAPRQ